MSLFKDEPTPDNGRPDSANNPFNANAPLSDGHYAPFEGNELNPAGQPNATAQQWNTFGTPDVYDPEHDAVDAYRWSENANVSSNSFDPQAPIGAVEDAAEVSGLSHYAHRNDAPTDERLSGGTDDASESEFGVAPTEEFSGLFANDPDRVEAFRDEPTTLPDGTEFGVIKPATPPASFGWDEDSPWSSSPNDPAQRTSAVDGALRHDDLEETTTSAAYQSGQHYVDGDRATQSEFGVPPHEFSASPYGVSADTPVTAPDPRGSELQGSAQQHLVEQDSDQRIDEPWVPEQPVAAQPEVDHAPFSTQPTNTDDAWQAGEAEHTANPFGIASGEALNTNHTTAAVEGGATDSIGEPTARFTPPMDSPFAPPAAADEDDTHHDDAPAEDAVTAQESVAEGVGDADTDATESELQANAFAPQPDLFGAPSGDDVPVNEAESSSEELDPDSAAVPEDDEPEETEEERLEREEHEAAVRLAAEREDQLVRLFQSTMHSVDNEKIGRVTQVYLDDQTQEPNWVTVKIGFFGGKEYFVPLAQATLDHRHLSVPYTREQVESSPRTEIDQNLSPSEEDALYNHYRVPGRMTEEVETLTEASGEHVTTDENATERTDATEPHEYAGSESAYGYGEDEETTAAREANTAEASDAVEHAFSPDAAAPSEWSNEHDTGSHGEPKPAALDTSFGASDFGTSDEDTNVAADSVADEDMADDEPAAHASASLFEESTTSEPRFDGVEQVTAEPSAAAEGDAQTTQFTWSPTPKPEA